MFSCLMEVPDVIMILCFYEYKCVPWLRISENKGNRNVKTENISHLLNTTVSHCKKPRCEADPPGGCTLTPVWCFMLYGEVSITASLILHPSSSNETDHNCFGLCMKLCVQPIYRSASLFPRLPPSTSVFSYILSISVYNTLPLDISTSRSMTRHRPEKLWSKNSAFCQF